MADQNNAPGHAICNRIARQLEIGGWHDAAEYVRSEWIMAQVADLAAARAENERLTQKAAGAEVETLLASLLQGKHSSLTIGFNDDHACNYMTAQEWHDAGQGYDGGDDDRIEWVSEDERLKAIGQNTVWTIQWYPRTPVGFCCIGASSLQACIEHLRAPEGERG